MRPLRPELKKAAEDASHDNAKLALMSHGEREEAARWCQDYAPQTVGTAAELARLYNLERAKFLRGQVSRIADTAPNYGRQVGYDWRRGAS